jgi:hypothetical protein
MDDLVMTLRFNIASSPPWAVAVFCLLIPFSSSLYAEDLPDPTRPPASIFAPPVAGVAQEAPENNSTGLRTIIISGTRRAAIIDGKTVELGGEHGNARLVEVNDGSVVLQRAKSRQVLTLFPDVKLTRKEALKNKSSDQESQVKQPLSVTNVQSGKHMSKPAEHHKKLLSVHPKEEK